MRIKSEHVSYAVCHMREVVIFIRSHLGLSEGGSLCYKTKEKKSYDIQLCGVPVA